MAEKKIAVIGSGSWATAIVKILLNNVEHINWWVREQAIVDSLEHSQNNSKYLSSVKFDNSKLFVSADLDKILRSSDIILLCIPAAFLHSSVGKVKPSLLKGKTVISSIKGIVPEFNLIVFEYLKKQFGVLPKDFVVVSGPSHAEEVAQEKLTYLTVASRSPRLSVVVAGLFQCNFINTTTSDDILGTEYGPVLKNIVAIASGICDGLGYGDNFQAVLISNAIQEMERFMKAAHPIDRDIKSSVYLGDLLVTCYSDFSRNRNLGLLLGKGKSVKTILAEMHMVAEGYYAAKCIKEINIGLGVYMPICEAVYNIMYKNKMAAAEMAELTEKLS